MNDKNLTKSAMIKRTLDEKRDTVSHFILCVKNRPPLYNYHLPVEQRRRKDIGRMWDELAAEIGGGETGKSCRIRWKHLRDTFHQYRLRNHKYKGHFAKWRFSKDLEFLTDIYQPKLKSQRQRYLLEKQLSQSDGDTRSFVEESKDSDTASLIEMDEDFIEDEQEVTLMKRNGNKSERVDPIEEVTVTAAGNQDTAYSEVILYDDAYISLEADTKTKILNDSCSSTSKEASVRPLQPQEQHQQHQSESSKEELDLFFDFLKAKISKMPSVDITAIQVEFLSSVLKKEAAIAANKANP